MKLAVQIQLPPDFETWPYLLCYSAFGARLSRVQQRARLLPFQGIRRDRLCHSFREKTKALIQPD